MKADGSFELTMLKSLPDPELKWVSDPLAVCMDGSPYGYYWQKASDPSSSAKWLFFLQGGGECYSNETCFDQCYNPRAVVAHCWLNKTGACGNGGACTNQQWKESVANSDQTFLSDDPDKNPVMHDWNHVYMPFCSQDQWSGTRESSFSTWGYRFAGHHIVNAVISELKTIGGLVDSETVVFSGVSSGGMGVYIHANWLQDQLPNTKVVVAPIAGFFGFGAVYEGPNKNPKGLAPFTEALTANYVKVWGSYLPQECAKTLGVSNKHKCFLGNFSAPFLKVPQFVIQPQTDCVQLLLNDYLPVPTELDTFLNKTSFVGHADSVNYLIGNAKKDELINSYKRQYLQSPGIRSFINAFKVNNLLGLMASLKPADGVFSPACFMHANFANDAPNIAGRSFMDGFNDWLFKGIVVRLVDDCGLFCGHCSLCVFA